MAGADPITECVYSSDESDKIATYRTADAAISIHPVRPSFVSSY